MNPQTKAQISALFPGPKFKDVRHQIYSTPDLLNKEWTDDQLQALVSNMGQAHQGQPEAPWADGAPEPGPMVGDQEPRPEEAAKAVCRDSQALVTRMAAEIVTITTPAEYEAASLQFSGLKKAIAANEAKRKELTAPILQAKQNIDAEFKATALILEAELRRWETPMIAFKTREREDLRAQDVERQRLVQAAEAEAKAKKEEATKALETVSIELRDARSGGDPFLAALLEDDLEDAKQGLREAAKEIMLAPSKVAPLAVTPIVGTGTKTSYPWKIEITDETRVERIYCSPDESKLKALAKLLKSTVLDITKLDQSKYPGLRITEDIRIGGR